MCCRWFASGGRCAVVCTAVHLAPEANLTSTVQMCCRWFAFGGRCAVGGLLLGIDVL